MSLRKMEFQRIHHPIFWKPKAKQKPTTFIKVNVPFVVKGGQRTQGIGKESEKIVGRHYRNLPFHFCCQHYVFDEIGNAINCGFEVVQFWGVRLVENLQRFVHSKLIWFSTQKGRFFKLFVLWWIVIVKELCLIWLALRVDLLVYLLVIITNFFFNIIIIAVEWVQIALLENVPNLIFNTIFKFELFSLFHL